MFTLSDVLSDWRYFDVAVVRFAEIVFRNPVTGTSLDFTPFSGEVWELDFYYNTYPGFAKYHDFYSHNYATLLWWLELGEDVYHSSPRCSDFHSEVLFSTVEAQLAARLVALEVLNLWGENPESEAL
ncbi:Uncharacterized protein APZ42_002866 [Daphnia magna]|uniref:Uncharacterized protein n=1 Tax=Daphnia magna TaxID=35525 RepID=A0A164HZN2_9CRUS|nr:Uncharacterized protein APZ42_002866 [Daphnia magna]